MRLKECVWLGNGVSEGGSRGFRWDVDWADWRVDNEFVQLMK